jgi:hypothetical protein
MLPLGCIEITTTSFFQRNAGLSIPKTSSSKTSTTPNIQKSISNVNTGGSRQAGSFNYVLNEGPNNADSVAAPLSSSKLHFIEEDATLPLSSRFREIKDLKT